MRTLLKRYIYILNVVILNVVNVIGIDYMVCECDSLSLSLSQSSKKPKPSKLPPISTDPNSTAFDVPLDTLSPLKMCFNGHGSVMNTT